LALTLALLTSSNSTTSLRPLTAAQCKGVSPWLALAGAAIAMTIEVLPLPVNDNVLVPVITGAALTALTLLV
jgi:dolichol kinase